MAIRRIGSGCSANIELFDIKYLCWLCHAIFEERWKTLDQIRSSTFFYFSTSVATLPLPPPLSHSAACVTFFPPPVPSSLPRIFNRGTLHQGSDQVQRVSAKYRVKFRFFNFRFVDFRRYSNVKMFRRVLFVSATRCAAHLLVHFCHESFKLNVFNEYVQFTHKLQETYS